MKKTLLVVITTLAALLAITATAERKIWLYSHSGNHVSLPVTDLDSISFETPTVLELSDYIKKFDSKGGIFTLAITTNQAWKAEVNNPIAVTLSKATGTGTDEITVTAMENTGTKSYSAIITVTALNGMYKQLILTVAGTEQGSLKLDPEIKNLASTGGRFPLNIQTDQAWTAMVSDPSALTLSKSSGAGSATINVSATVNADTTPYTEYVTVELEDGTKKQLTVNVSVNDEYVTSDIKGTIIEKKGGTFEANISSNTIWYFESSQPWLTVTPASGKFNGKVTVNVEANPNKDDEYATLNFTAIGGKTSSVSVTREGDRISVSPNSKTLPPAGGTYKIGVTSNTEWTVSANESWVTFDKTKGTLNDSIVVTVEEGDKDAASATITVTTTNGKTATCTIIHESDKISVSPSSKTFPPAGGTFEVGVTSNTDWTASGSKSWATLSVSSGNGNGTITITVSENTNLKADTVVVTLTTALGKSASTSIIRLGREKCKASDYPQVTIGTQTWMAENYRCSKYDTQSEAYNASWLTNNTIPTSESYTYTPYYTDASDKSKWDSYSKQDGVNLTDAQVAKLGYLYNWAAAVGVADGEKQTTAFSGNRQGICPNGWHVPSRAEWQTLQDYIEKTDGKGEYTAGKHLKTTSGWYSGDSYYTPGLDTYGFAALPASYARESGVDLVGHDAYFLSTTPHDYGLGSEYVHSRRLYSMYDAYEESVECRKYFAYSVRCLKD